MRIPNFKVENQRSIRLVECADTQKLMIIAGPNGAGKSTLLNALRTYPGQGPIMYVGPHRNARRQIVRWRNLLSAHISLEALLSRQDVPGYEGVQFLTGERNAWGFDDTANYLKHGLCQIEVDRKDAIAARYDRDREIAKDSLPDPWAPLKELTSNLLPYLSFDSIDASNKDQVRVLWRVHAKDTIVDLDDLSSGEKSIIQIFYPLIEARIKDILRQIQHAETSQAQPEICVLIDEPELHLHPNLQVKVFDYLRLLTATGRLQVIIATHSPTIVEYSSFEELFLLRPVEAVTPGENQLIQVATDDERLRFLREVFGSTTNLTALQPIVVVEGANQLRDSRSLSDRKLYRALHPGFDRVTLLSGGGKSDCIRLRELLEEALRGFSSEIRAVALLDRDLSQEAPPSGVAFLPVSMIENFLLDPDAIWESIQSVIEKTSFKSVEDISKSLDEILDSMMLREVERRVLRTFGRYVFQPDPPVDTLSTRVETFTKDLLCRAGSAEIENLVVVATTEVEDLKSHSQRREHFHGKEVLKAFSKIHLHPTGMAANIFTYETARHARNRKKVGEFFDSFFANALPEAKAPAVSGPD